MNRSTNISRPLGTLLGAMCLAVLSACGGGGDESAVNTPPQQASAAAVPTLCGVQITPTTGPAQYSVSPNQTMVVKGVDTQISLLTSATGFPTDGLTVNLALPLEDLREAPFLGYTPMATLDSMGVEFGSRMAPGAVACISGVSRATNVGTALNPSFLLSWVSATLPAVPLSALPSHAINGFEFINNFSNTQASAVFTMAKSGIANPAGVNICHIDQTGRTACSLPTISESALTWTFKLAITAPGLYLVTAPREELPLE